MTKESRTSMNLRLCALATAIVAATVATSSCAGQRSDTKTQKNSTAVASVARRDIPMDPTAPGRPWVSEPMDWGQVIDWEDGQYLRIGYRSDSINAFASEFAVTHSENGKAAEAVREQWVLDFTEYSNNR